MCIVSTSWYPPLGSLEIRVSGIVKEIFIKQFDLI